MKRAGDAKFPNSVQLFKFCQKVLVGHNNGKVHDQTIGQILGFNPSDCSHWKRGEKNVKSVFALSKLARALKVESSLIHDLANGVIKLEEAWYEYQFSRSYPALLEQAKKCGEEAVIRARKRIDSFVSKLLDQANFATPPLYLPEVMRFFPQIIIQQADLIDVLSRVLRTKPGQYTIKYKKGDLKPQTRMSIAMDLARIILEGERQNYPELGAVDEGLLAYEKVYFAINLILPQEMLRCELAKVDSRCNLLSELSATFWAPKTTIGLQLQNLSALQQPVRSEANQAASDAQLSSSLA